MHLADSSRPYTAFVTPWGLYQWMVLPMGRKTAPQAYQRMVCRVLQDFSDAYGTKPYIDDVCHGTPDSEDNPEFDVPPTVGCLERHFRGFGSFLKLWNVHTSQSSPLSFSCLCVEFVSVVKY